ncbi:hypothetical protein [Simkania sp.]|uniref:hypothetical protein n=1 Tax=Simkania sp. TaxID=34094 RepID=UPI003B519946
MANTTSVTSNYSSDYEITNGLSWNDWLSTSKEGLALRHFKHSDREMAEKELSEGGSGDACSLVLKGLQGKTFSPDLLPNSFSGPINLEAIIRDLNKNLENEKKLGGCFEGAHLVDGAVASFKKRWSELNPKLKDNASIKGRYELLLQSESLKEKSEHLTALFNLFLGDWVRTCQTINNEKNFYFLVIKHPNAQLPRDFGAYPLGKCGKGTPWKVHEKMSQIFTFNVAEGYEKNFSALVEVIRSLQSSSNT